MCIIKMRLAEVLCLNFGFGRWSVWAADSSQVPNKTQWHTDTTHYGIRTQRLDLRHALITASRRMALDWLSFSLEAKNVWMGFAGMWNYTQVALLLEVLCQTLMANNCESRWFWHRIKYILLFHVKTTGPWTRLVSDWRFFFLFCFVLLKHGWTYGQNQRREYILLS